MPDDKVVYAIGYVGCTCWLSSPINRYPCVKHEALEALKAERDAAAKRIAELETHDQYLLEQYNEALAQKDKRIKELEERIAKLVQPRPEEDYYEQPYPECMHQWMAWTEDGRLGWRCDRCGKFCLQGGVVG